MPRLIDYIEDKGDLIERIEIVSHASPEWPECDPSRKVIMQQKLGKNIMEILLIVRIMKI